MLARALWILFVFDLVHASVDRGRVIVFPERSRFEQEDVLQWVGDSATSVEICARAQDSLIARGFFGASVTESNDTIFVSEGSYFECDGLRWFGDSATVDAGIFSRLPLHDGAVFEFERVSESARMLLDWFEENGYPFADIGVDSLSIDHGRHSVAPFVMLHSGPRVSIEFVEFEGNVISRSSFLTRETRLRLRTVYADSKVESARRRLQRLEYLRNVEPSRIVANDLGKTGVLFRVQESRLSRLDIAAGLTPDASGDNETVTGLADLQLLNLFGTGRRGKLMWKRPAKEVQELALAWREPWLLGSPLALDLRFAQRVEDTLYVTRSYGVQLAIPLSSNLEVWGGVAREEFLVDSARAIRLGVTENRTLLFESGVRVDTRDHRSNPRSGVRFETWAAHGDRNTGRPPVHSDKTEFTQRRAAAEMEYASGLWRNWLLNLSGKAQVVESDEPEIPYSDLVKIGGARSLRGHREEQFAGSRVGIASLELRYWLGAASRFALFYDAGGILRSNRDTDATRLTVTSYPTAYGAGIRLETGIGIWGIDYGIASGASALGGQLHVSLMSLF